MRSQCPGRIGSLLQRKSASCLLGSILLLLALCLAIRSARLDAELASWIQRTGRVESELQSVQAAIGEGAGTNSLLILQAPNEISGPSNVLTVEALMVHLEALGLANELSVDLFDVSWSLRDICFAPTLPDFEGLNMNLMLDNLMPCAIKTPLDCFWEGARLLGPEQPVSFGSLGPKLKWTSLNPLLMFENLQRNYPHASFSYATLRDWMQRVGLTSGYQHKPCLDPNDPLCPPTAPNKLSRSAPDVAAALDDGCRGIAAKLMHWQQEELVGGATRNRSGHLSRAGALQSTIQLMGEQDMYDYWRKTHKVQDVNNWSTEKAKVVIDTWQRKYREQLDQLLVGYEPARPFKVHAITSSTMLDPINFSSLLDLTNLQWCLLAMSLLSCFAFPSFENESQASSSINISANRFKTTLLALFASSLITLTFIASLGLSSFMNLPFNLATTQILPPLALYYGFRQSILIANIFAQNCKKLPLAQLTTQSLNELLPVVLIECTCCVIPSFIASFIPVRATQAFAFQATTFTILSTIVAIIAMPAMFATFVLHHAEDNSPPPSANPPDYFSVCRPASRAKSRCESPFGTKRRPKTPQSPNIEDQIFSRLHDDLKYIKADSPSRDINFTARLDASGFHTSFSLTSGQPSTSTAAPSDIKLSKSDCVNGTNGNMESTCVPLREFSCETSGSTKTTNVIGESSEIKLSEEGGENSSDIEQQTIRLGLLNLYSRILTGSGSAQATILILRLCMVAAILTCASNVRYGLQLRDIVAKNTSEYESLLLQDRYFPIYNIFGITKGNFDYPSNQRLLHEYHKKFSQVQGVIDSEGDKYPKFWLTQFREWLLEIQQRFDSDRNISAISTDGWTSEASDSAKLAYKLLAQTGKADSPIDKSQVETNRLVDSQGIINPKAFYYYLTAWVMNDGFTYSITEGNFRPEPKTWNGNPDDLRVEKARPLTYTQIPFLVKLPSSHDNLKTILELRSISQAFEHLGLPNFPTGTPFIFWDQFINLDLVFSTAIALSFTTVYFAIVWIASSFITAAIILLPILTTTLETYGLLGLLSVPFNNILAVLIIHTIGLASVQTVPLTAVSIIRPHLMNVIIGFLT